MDKIRILGGQRLQGRVAISGAKNAALPLMVASLLSDQPLTLDNVPRLADIDTLAQLLRQHGVTITETAAPAHPYGHSLRLDGRNIANTTAPYDVVRKMRASVLVLGPLVARHGQARVSLPGGCAIGARPVDLHIKGLQHLGAEIEIIDGYIEAAAKNGLHGARIVFPQVSVGATENLLMAACLARGETQLVNAAREPEIGDLAQCLVAMGAKIDGIGTDCLIIQGVDDLHEARHSVMSDRIEAGTYAVAAAITGGTVTLAPIQRSNLTAFCERLEAAGIAVTDTLDGQSLVIASGAARRGVDITTEPFPGFPTDLQAQFMALMCLAEGASLISETVFENRFMHVPELLRLGANITIQHGTALVRGVSELHGAPLMSTDLRASSSLLLAGLAARGETLINRVYHLDRGYENIVDKLYSVGAKIERVS
ncbi:MAG: UDP-N-acetylglucosamine 1-carboxyvinyltransferase [Alphaproteobacteria bacterium]|nr:UDP-N-acetylglucosamine 1-carboxyvinyltransferase [Alphaproteobacteria bacterium]